MVFLKQTLPTERETAERTSHAYIFRGTDSYQGISIDGVKNIQRLLESCHTFLEIASLNSNEVEPEKWDKRSLFVFPGGKCHIWDQLFKATTIRKIKEFVHDGGNVLGVCAGAYFCSRIVQYQISDTQVIDRERDLAFFPGKCVGPLLSNNQPETNRATIQEVKIRWESDQSEGYVLMNGGGYFVPDPGVPANDYQVLARYADEPDEKSIAVVKCKVGEGVAILSGPHFEYSWEDIPFSELIEVDPEQEDRLGTMRTRLQESNHFRLQCFKEMQALFQTNSLSK